MCFLFDGIFDQLYHADGIAKAVDFKFTPSIRMSQDGDLHCPDEASGCASTKYILCSEDDEDTSVDQVVSFHSCWSENSPWSRTLAAKAEKCAHVASLDYTTIAACFERQGPELARAAAEKYQASSPDYVEGGSQYPKYGVPRVVIDGHQMGVAEHPSSYEDLLAMLCSKGINAGACDAPARIA